MKGKRGQGFLESILMWGVITIMLIGLLYISMNLLNVNYRIAQANDAVTNLAITADAVYNLGLNNKDIVRINIPSGIKSASVSGNEIAFDIEVKDKITKVSSKTRADVVGSVPLMSGRYSIPVKVVGDGIVKIGDGAWILYLEPDCALFSNLPLTVKIFGEDFNADLEVQVNGNDYPSSFLTYINPAEIRLYVIPAFFPPSPGGGQHIIQLYNPSTGWISNELVFLVYPAGVPNNC
ncbi:MAG: hypothetical protein AABY07_01960 [Nanoarchaeota archaeon]